MQTGNNTYLPLDAEQIALIKSHIGARADIDGDDSPCAKLIEHIEKHERDQDSETAQKYRKAAIDTRYEEGELEIDDNSIVSMGGDDGAYVQAWVWIANEEAGVKDAYDCERESQAP